MVKTISAHSTRECWIQRKAWNVYYTVSTAKSKKKNYSSPGLSFFRPLNSDGRTTNAIKTCFSVLPSRYISTIHFQNNLISLPMTINAQLFTWAVEPWLSLTDKCTGIFFFFFVDVGLFKKVFLSSGEESFSSERQIVHKGVWLNLMFSFFSPWYWILPQ